MRIILTLVMLTITSMLFSQEHDPKAGNCVNYVPPPPLPKGISRASRDGYAGCPVCLKARQDKYLKEMEEARQRGIAYQENIQKHIREREAAEAKRKQDLEKRNATALSQLNALQKDNVEFDRIREKERARKNAINAKYNEEQGRENRNYQAYLSNLQQVASTSLATGGDAFWNETVMAQNFLAYRDEKTGLFGFKDKKERIVIPAKFNTALNFSGGVTMVQYGPKQKYLVAMLNAKGETIMTFPRLDQTLKEQATLPVQNASFPNLVSDGIFFVPVSVRNPDYQTLVGLMNKDGKLITPSLFYRVEPFKNGVAKASILIDSKKTEFEEFPRDYSANYYYMEEGLIDKKGNWVQQPRKKLEYSYGSRAQLFLTVESEADRAMTKAERDLRDARIERNDKIKHDAAMSRLESLVKSAVSAAKANGYLIENLNEKK